MPWNRKQIYIIHREFFFSLITLILVTKGTEQFKCVQPFSSPLSPLVGLLQYLNMRVHGKCIICSFIDWIDLICKALTYKGLFSAEAVPLLQ